MASTLELANYSVSESFSKILKITNLHTKTTVDFYGEYASTDDGTFQLGLILMANKCKQAGKHTDYVYINLRALKCTSKCWVHLEVSLLDVDGEKTMAQGLSKKLSELQSDDIFYRFCSRESILASPSYLHNGTLVQLKVLFEVSLLKVGTRAPLATLSKDCASLLASGTFSDVTLVVGKMDFPAHKAILSARSPVFAKMLKESKESRVVLEEADEQVFKQLLNFIYTGRVWNVRENAPELLIAAEKYQLSALRDICGQYLSTTLKSDNLLTLLQLAHQHKAAQLQSKCLAFFEGHSKKVKLTENWKQLITVKSDVNQELLGLLLQTMATDAPVKKVKLSQDP